MDMSVTSLRFADLPDLKSAGRLRTRERLKQIVLQHVFVSIVHQTDDFLFSVVTEFSF